MGWLITVVVLGFVITWCLVVVLAAGLEKVFTSLSGDLRLILSHQNADYKVLSSVQKILESMDSELRTIRDDAHKTHLNLLDVVGQDTNTILKHTNSIANSVRLDFEDFRDDLNTFNDLLKAVAGYTEYVGKTTYENQETLRNHATDLANVIAQNEQRLTTVVNAAPNLVSPAGKSTSKAKKTTKKRK